MALDLSGLTGREALFRLSGAKQRDPAVAAWFATGPLELSSIAKRWFDAMRRCGPDVRELLHDGCPVACVEDAPFAYVNAFKHHVNVGFFRGATLADPASVLEGSGKHMRHIKLRPGNETANAVLRALIETAYADIKTRLRAERVAE